jgi:hypothetical protein
MYSRTYREGKYYGKYVYYSVHKHTESTMTKAYSTFY